MSFWNNLDREMRMLPPWTLEALRKRALELAANDQLSPEQQAQAGTLLALVDAR